MVPFSPQAMRPFSCELIILPDLMQIIYLLLWLLVSSLQGKEGKSELLRIVQTVEYNCGPEDKVETGILPFC